MKYGITARILILTLFSCLFLVGCTDEDKLEVVNGVKIIKVMHVNEMHRNGNAQKPYSYTKIKFKKDNSVFVMKTSSNLADFFEKDSIVDIYYDSTYTVVKVHIPNRR